MLTKLIYIVVCNSHCDVGIDVYKQRTFIYSGQEDDLLWEEYGIKFHFPSHTSQVSIECTVSVLSTDNSNYAFPVRSDLVSAVYGISASKQLPVPVTVQVQHCIPLHDDDEAARLGMSFMKATKKQGPPYVFHEVDGGDFRCGSSYGEIQLTHYCDIAIGIQWWVGYPIPFFASVFYTQNNMAKFVVTQNLRAHITVSSVQHTVVHNYNIG